MNVAFAVARVCGALALVAVFLVVPCYVTAQPRNFEPPPLTGYVNDTARLLTAAGKQRLEERLARFQTATGPQFVLLTIESLGALTVEQYGFKTATAWKLGDAQRDDGLLLLVAKSDRRLRIEVGHGLEGTIPDAVAARIIREVITPAFKTGDFEYGIEAGMGALIQAAGGTWEAPAGPVRRASLAEAPSPSCARRIPAGGWLAIFIVLGMVLLPFALAILHRLTGWPRESQPGEGSDAEPESRARTRGSSTRTSSSSSSRGWASSNSSSSSTSSSGSSFSGGGGSFGGGGASGSW